MGKTTSNLVPLHTTMSPGQGTVIGRQCPPEQKWQSSRFPHSPASLTKWHGCCGPGDGEGTGDGTGEGFGEGAGCGAGCGLGVGAGPSCLQWPLMPCVQNP